MGFVCSSVKCNIDTDFLIRTIDNGKELLAFCPNDEAVWVYSKIKNLEFQTESYPSMMEKDEKIQCEVCKETHEFKTTQRNPNYIYRTQGRDETIELHLCQNHMYRLIKRDLDPEDFMVIKKNHGIFHEIHDDFYDEEGFAMQPMEIL